MTKAKYLGETELQPKLTFTQNKSGKCLHLVKKVYLPISYPKT
jgi:hypothetical protein